MATGFDDDKYIKKPNTAVAYTDEQILQLRKCNDPVNGAMYFMENFLYIKHPMRGAILFEPYDYQRELIECMATHRKTVLLCGRQLGKCLDGSTMIKIKNKTTGESKEVSMADFHLMVAGDNKEII